MSNLKMDDIVEVQVISAAAITPRDGFNVGLIVGKTTLITAANRCLVVEGLDGLTDAGFVETDAIYKAATLYFGQNPRPRKLVVGVCAIKTGTTYETWVEALTACRAKNSEWWGCMIADTEITKADHTALAAYVETLNAYYFYSSNEEAALTDAATDTFSVLKAAGYQRSFGLYSSNDYAAAAVLGLAMGSNTGMPNSAFTLAYKRLVGVTVDDLSANDVAILKSKNANYYVERGGEYVMLEDGRCASGDWFDEILGLDQLRYNIQRCCMDTLTKTRTKIPYTDAGAKQIVAAVNEACEGARERGFLAEGIWKGENVLDLEYGDALPKGYLTQAVPVAERPLTEKQLRICPPIYVCAILAGAIHSVRILVNVM